ncbi:MAG: ECF-type sigma factor [Phycisphaerales bacterium]
MFGAATGGISLPALAATMPSADQHDNSGTSGEPIGGNGLHTLFPRAYDRLRALAAQFLRDERPERLLQATALVHEAFVRLRESGRSYATEGEFLAIAAAQMRHVLVDYARRSSAIKRGGGAAPVTLDSRVLGVPARTPFGLLDVDDALRRLAELDRRQGQLAELHLFGSLTIEEAADLLSISPRTAFNDWRAARAWLLAELAP